MSTETTPEMCGCHLPPRPMNAHASVLTGLHVWHEVSPGGTMIIPPQAVTIKITGLAGGGCRVESMTDEPDAPSVMQIPDHMWTPETAPDGGRYAHLWPCGCLINDAGAHRVGCPDHPEGVRG